MRIRHSNPELVIKALNSPVRKRILELVEIPFSRPHKLKHILHMTYSTLNEHLRILEEAGLIGILRLGKNTLIYPKVTRIDLSVRRGKLAAWYEPAEGLDGSKLLEDAVRVLYREGKRSK
ncbi:MAG: ArsR family transcriptional regulator [Candidatus Hadarchaeales archaeon]